jgi:hypothetical protein
VSHKRAFIIELRNMHLISEARTLFFIGEAREDVRFLMRWSLCTPKQQYKLHFPQNMSLRGRNH